MKRSQTNLVPKMAEIALVAVTSSTLAFLVLERNR